MEPLKVGRGFHTREHVVVGFNDEVTILRHGAAFGQSRAVRMVLPAESAR